MISSVTELPEQDFTAQKETTRPSSQAHCPFRAYLACPRRWRRRSSRTPRVPPGRRCLQQQQQLDGPVPVVIQRASQGVQEAGQRGGTSAGENVHVQVSPVPVSASSGSASPGSASSRSAS